MMFLTSLSVKGCRMFSSSDCIPGIGGGSNSIRFTLLRSFPVGQSFDSGVGERAGGLHGQREEGMDSFKRPEAQPLGPKGPIAPRDTCL